MSTRHARFNHKIVEDWIISNPQAAQAVMQHSVRATQALENIFAENPVMVPFFLRVCENTTFALPSYEESLYPALKTMVLLDSELDENVLCDKYGITKPNLKHMLVEERKRIWQK